VTGQLGIVQDIGWTTLYAIAQVASGATTAQVVATFNGDALDIVGANSRVIACDGGVWDSYALREVAPVPVFWDLALQTFVSFATVTGGNFPQYPSPEGGDGFVIGLAGNELAVVQGNQTAQTVLLFHTSTLPATPVSG
jgi:hypothetical protein